VRSHTSPPPWGRTASCSLARRLVAPADASHGTPGETSQNCRAHPAASAAPPLPRCPHPRSPPRQRNGAQAMGDDETSRRRGRFSGQRWARRGGAAEPQRRRQQVPPAGAASRDPYVTHEGPPLLCAAGDLLEADVGGMNVDAAAPGALWFEQQPTAPQPCSVGGYSVPIASVASFSSSSASQQHHRTPRDTRDDMRLTPRWRRRARCGLAARCHRVPTPVFRPFCGRHRSGVCVPFGGPAGVRPWQSHRRGAARACGAASSGRSRRTER
jgi:hypothetical protein